MTHGFQGWDEVAARLTERSHQDEAGERWSLSPGQRASLRGIAPRLPGNGVMIADEVGMGKTRIAVALARCVIEAGGRVAIVVPRGLGFQWQDELRDGGVPAPNLLSTLWNLLDAWMPGSVAAHQGGWFKRQLVLMSHNLANWRFGPTAPSWRWALLPALYAELEQNDERANRLRGEFRRQLGHPAEDAPVQAALHAAVAVAGTLRGRGVCPGLRRHAKELAADMVWSRALDAVNYSADQDFRQRLERAAGLGLGCFDLIIIDEAHKSRGEETGLSRMLERVVVPSANARRLGMTATPVELDAAQWPKILGRIGVPATHHPKIFQDYANACTAVRNFPHTAEVRDAYKSEAVKFHGVLSPYLLRRDKRELASVQAFAAYSGLAHAAYRHFTPIVVETEGLSPPWLQAVCAAEALSIVTRQAEDPVSKRLRLTIGNGHGIAALLDQTKRSETEDEAQQKHERGQAKDGPAPNIEISELTGKRQQRAKWWQQVIGQAFTDGTAALYDHPAVLKAAEAIEQIGGKVLVFGRFTLPLRALTALLNARAMLRALDKEELWPQRQVHENEWLAVQAAHRQLNLGVADKVRLNEQLGAQYDKLSYRRERDREQLINILNKCRLPRRVKLVYEAFRKSAEAHKGEGDLPRVLVANALHASTGTFAVEQTADDLAQAFTQLIEAALERDEGGDDDLRGESQADELWVVVHARLAAEYNRSEGSFARVMNGNTAHETRRLLQLAFNRPNSHPHVLVAQSLVGREGLNLHRACRAVVLLHPEWNPGVVEQQIGRIDRVGSQWERDLKEALRNGVTGEALPRIMVHPVIFRGTYDEANWQVLMRRWDDLRAQLNGIVIRPDLDVSAGLSQEIINAINHSAPDFQPR